MKNQEIAVKAVIQEFRVEKQDFESSIDGIFRFQLMFHIFKYAVRINPLMNMLMDLSNNFPKIKLN